MFDCAEGLIALEAESARDMEDTSILVHSGRSRVADPEAVLPNTVSHCAFCVKREFKVTNRASPVQRKGLVPGAFSYAAFLGGRIMNRSERSVFVCTWTMSRTRGRGIEAVCVMCGHGCSVAQNRLLLRARKMFITSKSAAFWRLSGASFTAPCPFSVPSPLPGGMRSRAST